MEQKQSFWGNLFHSGHVFEKDDTNRYRLEILNSIIFIALLSQIPFTFIDVVSLKDYGSIPRHIAITSMCIFLIIYLRTRSAITVVARFFLGFVFFMIIYFLWNDEASALSLVNLFVFPTFAYLLRGRKEGLLWTGILLSLFTGFCILNAYNLTPSKFNGQFLNSVYFIFLITIVFIHTYQRIIDNKEQALTERKDELATTADQLTKEVETRRKTEMLATEQSQKLSVQNDELSRMNKMMVDRELKMVAMKNEITELKSKLGIQT
jgi:hypothetical protein